MQASTCACAGVNSSSCTSTHTHTHAHHCADAGLAKGINEEQDSIQREEVQSHLRGPWNPQKAKKRYREHWVIMSSSTHEKVC